MIKPEQEVAHEQDARDQVDVRQQQRERHPTRRSLAGARQHPLTDLPVGPGRILPAVQRRLGGGESHGPEHAPRGQLLQQEAGPGRRVVLQEESGRAGADQPGQHAAARRGDGSAGSQVLPDLERGIADLAPGKERRVIGSEAEIAAGDEAGHGGVRHPPVEDHPGGAGGGPHQLRPVLPVAHQVQLQGRVAQSGDRGDDGPEVVGPVERTDVDEHGAIGADAARPPRPGLDRWGGRGCGPPRAPPPRSGWAATASAGPCWP